MNREEAKQYVKDNLDTYLTYKGINSNRTFKCLNPAHADNKPSMSVDRRSNSGLHCHCFSCGAYYDTFDLIGIDYGFKDETEIFHKAYEIFDIQVDGENKSKTVQKRTKTQQTIHNKQYTIRSCGKYGRRKDRYY